ncbi:MAG TPA: ABC transporter substrate-binding protein [Actinomycetales bacterium]|nr:ABC transporter substrate-binding protein [Actinomycetales bacterium]
MLLAACGGDSGGDGDTGGGEEAAGGGAFTVQIGEPQNPLVPGNTNETEGGQVVDSLFTGLITYNNETTELEYNGVAESIESEDSTNWTVTLKDGWTFHDGTPVTADSFVDAWNYTALSTNAFGNSYFFANVVGYEDLQGEADAEGNEIAPPAATEMSGLVVEDDLTFTVELTSPFAQYPITTGYTAFYPLPEAFFEDPEAFGTQPIGNGPFQAEEPFVPGTGITLTKYDDFGGEEPAKADSVEYRVYAELNTAYTDAQAGNIDIVPQIPPDAITSAQDTFGDRYFERASSSFTYIGFPTYDPRFEDKRVRQAFSMAIDREAITEAIFNGSREPAYSVISPVVAGSRDDACQYCTVDVEAANALLDEAGFDRSQPVEWWFNAGAGHDQWVQAAANQVRDNLGIDYTLKGDLQFAEYLPLLDSKGMTGPFRLGWIMDYPSPQNFLEPLYSTQAIGGSNASFYSNPEFDALIAEGNSATDNDEAIAAYQAAEDLLLEDMPIMPMFFGKIQGVHSENVTNVQVTAFGRLDAADVEVVNP